MGDLIMERCGDFAKDRCKTIYNKDFQELTNFTDRLYWVALYNKNYAKYQELENPDTGDKQADAWAVKAKNELDAQIKESARLAKNRTFSERVNYCKYAPDFDKCMIWY